MMHSFTTHHKQMGSGLMLVVFILVVIVGFIASIAVQNQQRSSDQLIASLIGTRAEMAARSGSQIEISRFYTTATTGSCHSSSSQTITFQNQGLSQCTATVNCTSLGMLDDGSQLYQLQSTGQCTVGEWQLQRVIEVGVKG
ncbi:MSHA biogenesis protein MshP [Vibrio ostreicida]|uniref:MSHA biogenesis protein MshP n=1 Tax=Vibrio ostreicida TaxID=526588 RepID=UPI003B5AA968